jgi:hypothetical protein
MGKSLRSHVDPEGEVVPNDRPPDIIRKEIGVGVRSITVEVEDLEGTRYAEILSQKEWEVNVKTMYKRKDKKVNPMNVPLPDGINPGGGIGGVSLEGMEGMEGKKILQGSRLTPERLGKMKIGTGFLSEAEKQLFVDILFEYEAAIAFDDSEMGLLRPEIEPPVIIHTVPHSPWQQQNLRLPKAMQEAATNHVKEKLVNGTLEFSQGLY